MSLGESVDPEEVPRLSLGPAEVETLGKGRSKGDWGVTREGGIKKDSVVS